jgi:hypothetical protein
MILNVLMLHKFKRLPMKEISYCFSCISDSLRFVIYSLISSSSIPQDETDANQSHGRSA